MFEILRKTPFVYYYVLGTGIGQDIYGLIDPLGYSLITCHGKFFFLSKMLLSNHGKIELILYFIHLLNRSLYLLPCNWHFWVPKIIIKKICLKGSKFALNGKKMQETLKRGYTSISIVILNQGAGQHSEGLYTVAPKGFYSEGSFRRFLSRRVIIPKFGIMTLRDKTLRKNDPSG